MGSKKKTSTFHTKMRKTQKFNNKKTKHFNNIENVVL